MMKQLIIAWVIVSLANLAGCKARKVNPYQLKNFATTENQNQFVLHVAGIFESRFTNPEACYFKHYTNEIEYLDPFKGESKKTISVSTCVQFNISRSKLIDGQLVKYDTVKLQMYQILQKIKSLYCPRKQFQPFFDPYGQEILENIALYNECLQQPEIDATIGYFVHLGIETPPADLEEFNEVRKIQLHLLNETEISDHPYTEVIETMTQRYGTGSPNFQIPVLAMVSGLASAAMYAKDIDYELTEPVEKAKRDIEQILLRKLAVSNGFVNETPSAKEIIEMPDTCHRKVENACLSYRCTNEESIDHENKWFNDYYTCKPSMMDAIKAFTLIMALPVTLGTNVILAHEATRNPAAAKALADLNKLQYDVAADIGNKQRITVDTKSWDLNTIDTYLKAFGLEESLVIRPPVPTPPPKPNPH